MTSLTDVQWLQATRFWLQIGFGISFLSGCLIQLAKYTLTMQCFFSLSVSRATNIGYICVKAGLPYHAAQAEHQIACTRAHSLMHWHSEMGGHHHGSPRTVLVETPSQWSTLSPACSLLHTLSSLRGGFLTIRHNKIRDITAGLLTEVCHDGMVEPNLLPLTGEALTTSNTPDRARLDMAFWGGRFERTFSM